MTVAFSPAVMLSLVLGLLVSPSAPNLALSGGCLSNWLLAFSFPWSVSATRNPPVFHPHHLGHRGLLGPHHSSPLTAPEKVLVSASPWKVCPGGVLVDTASASKTPMSSPLKSSVKFCEVLI